MAKTRTPEQRANMSAAQRRRYAIARANGISEKTIPVGNVLRANDLLCQLLELVDVDTAIALLKSLGGKSNA